MTEHVRFLDRCRHCGLVTDLTSTIQHSCADEYNTIYNEQD